MGWLKSGSLFPSAFVTMIAHYGIPFHTSVVCWVCPYLFLAIARALVFSPRLLIADEPTGNLDPKNAWEIIQLLLKINKLGTTVILATHNRDIVDAISKRVITMKAGRITSDRRRGKYKVE